MAPMKRRFVGLLICLVFLAGCDQAYDISSGGDDRLAAPLNTISIYQLAGRLNMSVTNSTSVMATLNNSANVVMIFADPEGQVFVNGSPVGKSGGIDPAGGVLFVPVRVEADIRPSLQTPARRPPVAAGPTASSPPVTRTRHPARLARVVVDPGHGGTDPGTTSVLGMDEKHVVLDAALTVADRLRAQNASVIMTRTRDTSIVLNDRAELANKRQADLFVSIHADWAPSRDAKGYTIYIARTASPQSLALANAISRRLDAQGIPSRGIRRKDFRVLVRTICPAVLVELGYMSNKVEAAKLNQRSYRTKLAEAISAGVVDYCNRQ